MALAYENDIFMARSEQSAISRQAGGSNCEMSQTRGKCSYQKLFCTERKESLLVSLIELPRQLSN